MLKGVAILDDGLYVCGVWVKMVVKGSEEESLSRILGKVSEELDRISSQIDKIIEMDEGILQHLMRARACRASTQKVKNVLIVTIWP